MSVFINEAPNINGNKKLRLPQEEGFKALAEHFEKFNEQEVGVILPVGCGKSGLIAITPFAYKSKRTLVVAPGLKIAEQLYNEIEPSHPENFYKKCIVLGNNVFPEPVEIRGTSTNRLDLNDAEIVVTNIQQLQGESNKWLEGLPEDFFDLILFDEGHHGVANSWIALKKKFPKARVVNYSATPLRADGQIMSGKVIYSFPVFRAIREGYVKRLKAICLNPQSLKYVRQEGDQEVEVTLDEVRQLGESDADFRRSIVTSKATLFTIVDASINELYRLRTLTNESRLKIIATALNQQHCVQVTAAYNERGLRAEYIHSNLDGVQNARILQKLENHEIDVIVQVRKLGEGFNHVYLSVAAVFNVFNSLSPFVQFIGRIMRVIEQNAIGSLKNQGSVIYHAGSNIASRWSDFQTFSDADQDYFEQLLPEEGLHISAGGTVDITPEDMESSVGPRGLNQILIKSQEKVSLEEDHLLQDDMEAKRAFELLVSKGFTAEQYSKALVEHTAIPVSKFRARQASRKSLEEIVKLKVGEILNQKKIKPQGSCLDKKRLGRTNFQTLKSAFDLEISKLVGRKKGERSEFSANDFKMIEENFDKLVVSITKEIFNGEA